MMLSTKLPHTRMLQRTQRTRSVSVHALAKTKPAPSIKSSKAFGKPLVPIRARNAQRSRGQRVTVEANLFSRFFRVIRSGLDNLLGSYEDPEVMLDRVVTEMNQDAMRMRQASAQAMASQRQMAARYQNVQDAADQWLRRAELAVSQGEDGLAKEALMRRKTLQTDADRLQQQLQQQQKATDQLRSSVLMLENKIQEAKNKKETLKARAATARSSKAIQELVGGMQSSTASSFAAFEQMEQKVMSLEAEAESTAAMAAPDSIETRFQKLEGGGVEDELKALKQGMKSQPAGSLPRPRYEDVLQRTGPQAEFDLELEELRKKARG